MPQTKAQSQNGTVHDESEQAKKPLPGQKLVPFHLKIHPQHIVELQTVIESYEGLGVVRTLNPDTGTVVIIALGDTAEDVRGMLNSLRSRFDICELPLPETADESWLFANPADAKAADSKS